MLMTIMETYLYSVIYNKFTLRIADPCYWIADLLIVMLVIILFLAGSILRDLTNKE